MQALVSKEEIEFVARAICKTRGVNPDCKVTRNIEYKTLDGLIVLPDDKYTIPAWKDYHDTAVQAILAVRQFQRVNAPLVK